MKNALRFVMILTALAMAAPVMAENHMPGKGVTVNPGRATWNTGFFQEAIVRQGLTELGYDVKKPKDLANPLFYQSVALGDVDYWANGWFPIHDNQLPKNFYDSADTYGYIIEAGGLQGYLVSKKHAEEYNIQSLEDFKRPEVMEAFDANGDGKADMVACPPGWGCEKIIAHHMEVYEMDDYVNLVKASYSASMAEALARYQNGDPVFFYTWAPNWTIFKFKPGEDVMWINVPEIKPDEAQKDSVEKMTVSGVKGAVSDPIKLGFVVSDVRMVANKKFAEENPAARKFFEEFSLPLEDVNRQNTLMEEGEDSQADIERHAAEWVKENQAQWDEWMAAARAAAKE